MITVLDQYEIEYKETYTSGTYDQVVMGKMFYTKTVGGQKLTFYGNRGVVYGAINSNQAPTPGTGIFDSSKSFSYSLQPYKEKAGNCKAAKHLCYEERIYDTTVPDAVACFKRNGANIFASNTDFGEAIGVGALGSIAVTSNAFIMFDSYVPLQNGNTKNLNVGVDRHWTKSYPFEPRYGDIQRQKFINFSNVEASHIISFASSFAVPLPIKKKLSGLIVGTAGRDNVDRSNKSILDFQYSTPLNGMWKHHWCADTSTVAGVNVQTGSAVTSDLIKTIFGFGDSCTTFFDNQIKDSNNPTGYALRGTNNWPEFRARNKTNPAVSAMGYEALTGSYWNFSPIIRGWKYGLYNGLPDYTSAYFRQGKYGQFRDMLEQRMYTVTVNELLPNNPDLNCAVSVKFLDSNENLTEAINTHSQNLSMFATSSLPYFDLQQRNRPLITPLSNISLINFSLDNVGNITI